MLKIKLARFGKRHQPHFRIVVNEARDKRDGSYVENIGHYAPTAQPKILELDIERYDYWVANGAQPTETVAGLAKRAKSDNPFPEKKAKPSKKAQAKAAETAKAELEAKEAAEAEKAAAKEAEAKAKEETETPAEEAAPETETEATEEATE